MQEAFPAFAAAVLAATVAVAAAAAVITACVVLVALPEESVALAASFSVDGSKLATEDWSSVSAYCLVSAISVAKPVVVQYLHDSIPTVVSYVELG